MLVREGGGHHPMRRIASFSATSATNSDSRGLRLENVHQNPILCGWRLPAKRVKILSHFGPCLAGFTNI